MEPKQKNYLYILCSMWLAFAVFLKLMEHQRAYNDVQLGFRYDLCIVFPILLIISIIVLWKNWDDMNDDEN
jgi:hypothetical protein